MAQRLANQYPCILAVLSSAWDTSGGQSLRALMWSLHNDRVAVDLWSRLTDLDDSLREEFAQLIALPLDGRGYAVEDLLVAGGEWDRIDEHVLIGEGVAA